MPNPRVRPGGRILDVRTITIVAVALVGWLLAPVLASSPKFFQADTQADFLKGELENLSVDSHGRLVLGPATDLVYETAAPFLWSVITAPDGSLFVGTGNEGKVFRIDAEGKGSTFFDAPELEVHALAPAPNGGLYVATSPDGKIYRVDRTGASVEFFDPEEKYIWSLAVDARGNLYAGTGEKGVIYKVTPDGKGSPFYKARATHVTALTFDRSGNLLVGTGSPGRVLRVDPEGKAFLLLDSPFQEIRTLHFDDKGSLYAAAFSGRASSGGSPSGSDTNIISAPLPESTRAPVPSVSAEITSMTVVDGSGGSTDSGSTREDRRAARGAIYRIAADGVWDQLWESRDESPFDLAFDANGAVIVGTGNTGKIYRLEGDPLRPTLLARASAQQVTAFSRDARGRLYYATANPGKLYRLTTERAARGTYESQTFDAQVVATWGAISWRRPDSPGGQVEVATRSGNTETPDDTWSPWSATYTGPQGSPITSPKARYLQWRVVMAGRGDGPVLTSITAAYLPRNLRPQVRSVTVHPPGIVFQKPYTTGEPDLVGFDDQSTPDRKLMAAAMNTPGSSSPSLGRRAYQKSLQTIAWRADDDNDDELTYDVLYRLEGDVTWKALKRGLTEAILVWDTTTVPSGTYFVKVMASDLPSNPSGSLTGELDSSGFEIDNTPPVLTVRSIRVENGRTLVAFDAKDDHSPIQRAEYSTDGERWLGAFPRDGIADSTSEQYELSIGGELGDRGLILRVTDAMNNVETLHVDAPRRR